MIEQLSCKLRGAPINIIQKSCGSQMCLCFLTRLWLPDTDLSVFSLLVRETKRSVSVPTSHFILLSFLWCWKKMELFLF